MLGAMNLSLIVLCAPLALMPPVLLCVPAARPANMQLQTVLPASTHVHRVAQVAVIKVMSVAVSAVQEPTWMPPQVHIAHAIKPLLALNPISVHRVSQENISSVMHLVPLNV